MRPRSLAQRRMTRSAATSETGVIIGNLTSNEAINVGIVPVTKIDDQAFEVGSETTWLMKRLHPPVTGTQYRFAQWTAPPR